MHRTLRLALLFLPLALPGYGILAAQGTEAATGEIHLHVQGPDGRSVPAHATVAGPKGLVRQKDVARDGRLDVFGLAPGRYQVKLSEAGFAEQMVVLRVGATSAIDRVVTLRLPDVLATVSVIASTPIGSLDVAVSDVPVPVQSITAQTIQDTNAIDLTDVLKKRMNGVYVNENQDNPFQPDVNYRGYTASPLVGAPAGLSVFLDGVRQNEPFGDVVAWDLIPKVAISSTELIPGSTSVYGLNTLGGAIAVQTKSGLTQRGLVISGYGGAFGRRDVDGEYGGGNNSGFHWYAGGTLFHEDGWRVQSPSGVKQSFAKLGYERDGTSIALSGGYAINNLTGNGTQDVRAIARTTGLNHGYNSVYSIPDATQQHSPFLTVNATHSVRSKFTLNGNAYVRYIRTNTTNGDINDNSFDQSLYTLSTADKAALTAAGIPFPASITPANTPFPSLRCIAQGLEQSEPGEKCTGVDTDTNDKQHAFGFTGVASWQAAYNRLAVGAGWDHGALTFIQSAQYGYLNPDGITITRIPSYLDGSTNIDDAPQDNRINLHGTTSTPSFFVTDTLTLGKWVFHAAGRYNHTTINNLDRLPPASYRGTLTAVNSFERFNPSAGLVYKMSGLLHLYFDYSEGSRAPTSTELGCADPNFPCSLPNALVSDPPLKQVVSRTFEGGVRGNPEGTIRWNAGFFHTDNDDDLLFVASQQTGYGYFQNFGQTRRLGLETSVAAHLHSLEAGAEYTFLNATYQSPQTLGSGSNSSNSNATSGGKGVTDGGTIDIEPGDRIPEIPQHVMKLYADYRPIHRLSVDADFSLVGASYVRGNENNQHTPDGVYYLGPGQSPGYGVVNLGTRYTISSHYELFAQINNALNRHYYTGGQLASTPYDNNGNFIARPFAGIQFQGDTEYPVRNSTFLAPGAPITVFGGLRVSFGTR